jgi:hypothetical protein
MLAKGVHMARLEIKRSSHISLVEEAWWIGELDGKEVEIHAKIYRCDSGPRSGQFGTNAHLHRIGGGEAMLYRGAPNPENLFWADTRDGAIEGSLKRLASKDDLQLDLIAN